ncbi:MAG: PQQ-binding-like beta-propeller repeat protein [Planctomycetota bacterium]
MFTSATLLAIASVVTLGGAANSDDWPQWRGPDGNGVSGATNLPTEWGPEKNVVWKTALPGWSGATPIITGDHIFLTSPSKVSAEELAKAEEEARQREAEREESGRGRGRGRRGRGGSGRGGGRHPGGQELMLVCLSRTSGEILWEKQVDEGNRLFMKGNSTSPSPVTDGKHVWVVTGNGQVTAFDLAGQETWKTNLQETYGEFGLNWGYASSPLLYQGQLIIEVLHGMRTEKPSYLVSLEAATGKVLWKVDRPTDAPRESPDAYTTPLLVKKGDKTQIIISGGDYVTGHDPKDGKELWRIAGLNPRKASNYRIVASPILAGDVLVAPTRVRPMLGIALGDELKPTDESIAWRFEDRGGPDVPTPTTDGKRVYVIDDSAMATCLDAKSGEVIWGPERTVNGRVSSSPLLADGKIYVTTEEGTTVVLAAGDTFKILAENQLDGSYTLASPIATGGQIFIRTGDHLYCLGNVQKKDDSGEE